MVVDPDFRRLLSFSLEWSLTFSACSSNQLLIRSWIDFSFGRSDRFPFEVFLERCDCTSMRNVSVALFSFALSLLICFAACCWTLSWNSASFAVSGLILKYGLKWSSAASVASGHSSLTRWSMWSEKAAPMYSEPTVLMSPHV